MDSDRARAKEHIRRRCSNREIRKLLMAGIENADSFRITKKGVLFFNGGQHAVTHFTVSDRRGVKNFRRDMIRAGIIER